MLGIPQTLLLAFTIQLVDSGRLSMYAPSDGFNKGHLACGGLYTKKQSHIAYRRWRVVGCKAPVLVCAAATGHCEMTRVMDAGPFGIYRPPLRRAVSEGRWKLWTASRRPPEPWRFRAAVDLSVALWKRLGRPPFLSPVSLLFFKRVEPRRRPRLLSLRITDGGVCLCCGFLGQALRLERAPHPVSVERVRISWLHQH